MTSYDSFGDFCLFLSRLDLCKQNQPSLPPPWRSWRVWRAMLWWLVLVLSRSRLGMAGHLLCGLGPHGPLLRSAKALLRPREDRQVLGGAESNMESLGNLGNPWKSPIKIDLKRIKLRFEFEWEPNAITGGLNGNHHI